MQTFLPVPNFMGTAKILDWRRLGRQRTESRMLLDGLLSKTKNGWRHHPANKMWIGFTDALASYMNEMILEWKRRGYNNTMILVDLPEIITYPPWLGNNKYHSAYRAILLAKDYDYYSQFGWTERPSISVWPYPIDRKS